MTTPPAPRLAVHDAAGRRLVAVDKPLFRIGRGANNDLQIVDPEVSRDHAEIAVSGGACVIRDRQSRHGTFVNGVRTTQHRLAHGDRVELGGSGAVLLFLADDTPVERGAAPAAGDLRQVATLLDVLREMGSDRVLDEVLVLVLDSAIEATGAERGFILLADEHGELRMTMARGAGHVPLATGGFGTSRKIPEEVFATGRIKVVADLLEDEMAAVHTGTVALGIRHVMCAPLRLVRYVDRREADAAKDRNIGVLYLDSRERGRLLSAPARTALEALATQAALAIENARLYKQGLEKARLDEELGIASRIQQALLPESRRSGAFFEVVGASIPSRAIGGDFFDYQELADHRFVFGLGDITGHGPAAAIVTALVQGVLATCALAVTSPNETIAVVNRVLQSRRVEAKYLTLFLGVLAPDGRLAYCNAAHNAPLLFTAAGVQRLEVGGTLVGAFPDPKYDRGELQLAPGDTLVLFSDGVTEALSAAGEEFEERRVRAVVEAALEQPAEQVLNALLDAVRAFTGAAAPQDDVTAVVLRYGAPRRS